MLPLKQLPGSQGRTNRRSRTAAERLGFDSTELMNKIGESFSALPTAVAQLLRWEKEGFSREGAKTLRRM